MKLRPAPLIRLNLDNEYRVPTSPQDRTVHRQVHLLRAVCFAGRRREIPQRLTRFLQDAPLRFRPQPDPAFPGCMYSEMKMCLAPCFKGCTDEAYHVEVSRCRAIWIQADHR